MLNPVSILLAGLVLVTAAFVYAWWRSAVNRGHPHPRPGPFVIAVGAVTLFFDTLGIGNYAPTTAIFRMFRMVKDELIPGTMTQGVGRAGCHRGVRLHGGHRRRSDDAAAARAHRGRGLLPRRPRRLAAAAAADSDWDGERAAGGRGRDVPHQHAVDSRRRRRHRLFGPGARGRGAHQLTRQA